MRRGRVTTYATPTASTTRLLRCGANAAYPRASTCSRSHTRKASPGRQARPASPVTLRTLGTAALVTSVIERAPERVTFAVADLDPCLQYRRSPSLMGDLPNDVHRALLVGRPKRVADCVNFAFAQPLLCAVCEYEPHSQLDPPGVGTTDLLVHAHHYQGCKQIDASINNRPDLMRIRSHPLARHQSAGQDLRLAPLGPSGSSHRREAQRFPQSDPPACGGVHSRSL
jgi:hypothetical protein